MSVFEMNPNWIEHLKGQFEQGRPILFTGAGFSLAAENILEQEIPSYSALKERLWNLCFPGDPFDPASGLQDLYEHALQRHRNELKDLLSRSFAVNPKSLPDWYRLYAELPWKRMYTLNIDDLDTAWNSRFFPPRPFMSVSATSHAAPRSEASLSTTESIHLNGELADVPEFVTFSVTQYADRAKADLWYIRFTADLVTNPIVFVGTRLEEPPLWQHLVLRHGRGGRELSEMRHRSYLVTPTLDRAKQALLAQYHVVWLPMTAEEFATSVLSRFTSVAPSGFAALAAQSGIDNRSGKLRDVAELAVNPGEANEFFMGSEPIWADVQSGRAIERDVDAAVLTRAKDQLPLTDLRGIVLLSGTAGSGKSTSLKRFALSLSAEGTRVGWVDRFTEISPLNLRKAMNSAKAPAVLAMDEADIYGNELPRLLRDICTLDSRPLVAIAVRSSRVDRALASPLLEGIPVIEHSMPPLSDPDIPKLLDALERAKRLGILTGKSRPDQVKAFRDEAGRQLLVAMIKATSGKELKDKAFEELADLSGIASEVYAVICLATAFKFGLSKDEVLIATRDNTNTSLNALAVLLSRHIVTADRGGMVACRHRVIADLIVDELKTRGHLANAVTGLALLAATKVAQHLHRSARPWRMLKQFINNEFLRDTCGLQYAQNLYGELEELLSWDYHFWLQRGSLEVKYGDIRIAEHFLATARSLGEGDFLVDTEWAYLLFRKATDEFGIDAPSLVEEATLILKSIIVKSHDRYAYHILGSQGLSWARYRISDRTERERYLRNLMSVLEFGCQKNPRGVELQNLLNDVKFEYLKLAVKPPPSAPPAPGATST